MKCLCLRCTSYVEVVIEGIFSLKRLLQPNLLRPQHSFPSVRLPDSFLAFILAVGITRFVKLRDLQYFVLHLEGRLAGLPLH